MTTVHAAFVVPPPRYQLPAYVTLGAVTLQVANIERSIAYYRDVIGLSVIQRSANEAQLGAMGSSSPLVLLQERIGAVPVPPRGRLGLYHFAILLPDRPALGRFLSHLAALGLHAGMADHLVSEAIYLDDPDGLGIEVYADRSRKSWVMDGAAIRMATDPLDVRSVVAAGGSTPWSGMPPGARIGHVHLHVGNLPLAERFYHEQLGFDKVTLQFPGALFLSAGGYHHHVGTNIWAASSPAATDSDARLLQWTVTLPGADDVEDIAQSLAAAGTAFVRDSAGVSTKDAWGTQVRLAF